MFDEHNWPTHDDICAFYTLLTIVSYADPSSCVESYAMTGRAEAVGSCMR
jgi:hypothetical protein